MTGEYDKEVPQSHTVDGNSWHCEEKTRKKHQEDNLSKAISCLFLIKLIAKLERTLSTLLNYKDQTQNLHKQ